MYDVIDDYPRRPKDKSPRTPALRVEMNSNNKRVRPSDPDDVSSKDKSATIITSDGGRNTGSQGSYNALKEENDGIVRAGKAGRDLAKRLDAEARHLRNANNQSLVNTATRNTKLSILAEKNRVTIEEQQKLLGHREATISQLEDSINNKKVIQDALDVRTTREHETAITKLRSEHEVKTSRMQEAVERMKRNHNAEKVTLSQQHADAMTELKDKRQQGYARHNDLMDGLKNDLDLQKTAAGLQNETIIQLRKELAEKETAVINLEERFANEKVLTAELMRELGAEKEATLSLRGTVAFQELALGLQEKVNAGLQARIDLASLNAQSGTNTTNHEAAVALQGNIIAGLEAKLMLSANKP